MKYIFYILSFLVLFLSQAKADSGNASYLGVVKAIRAESALAKFGEAEGKLNELANLSKNLEGKNIDEALAMFNETQTSTILFKNIDEAIEHYVSDVSSMLYRGDTRIPDEIFKDGFNAKGTNSNIVDYVELNEPSIFIGTSKSPDEALLKIAQNKSEGFIYIINKKGNMTDVNNWYNSVEGYSNPHASELEVIFEKNIPFSNIKGAFKVDNYGNIIGDFIPNPNFISK